MPLFIVYQDYVPSAFDSAAKTFRVNAIEDEDGNDVTHQLEELDISFDYRDNQSGYDLLRKQIADSLDLEMRDIALELTASNPR